MRYCEIFIHGDKQNLKKQVNNSLDTAHHLIRQLNEKFKRPEQIYLKSITGKSKETKLRYLVQEDSYQEFEDFVGTWIDNHEMLMSSKVI